MKEEASPEEPQDPAFFDLRGNIYENSDLSREFARESLDRLKFPMPNCRNWLKERGRTPQKTTIACLFIDVTKVHWVGAIGGAVLGAYFFFIKLRAEKIYFEDIRRRRGTAE
jgi:hypothetical protein